MPNNEIDFESMIEDLKSELSDKEDEIEKLKSDLEDANDQISDLQDEVKELEKENSLLRDELDEVPTLSSEDLGLDTIHYYLESGNLKVSQQLESAFNLIKS